MANEFPNHHLEVKALMRCGHISSALSQADDGERRPVCILCVSTDPVNAKKVIDLSGRLAKCIVCGNVVKSEARLRSFKYDPKRDFDLFYDSCEE